MEERRRNKKEREKSISVSFVMSCLHMTPGLGLSYPGELTLTFPLCFSCLSPSPILLIPLLLQPFLYFTPTLTSPSAPHSNTCSLVCCSAIFPSLFLRLPVIFFYLLIFSHHTFHFLCLSLLYTLLPFTFLTIFELISQTQTVPLGWKKGLLILNTFNSNIFSFVL